MIFRFLLVTLFSLRLFSSRRRLQTHLLLFHLTMVVELALSSSLFSTNPHRTLLAESPSLRIINGVETEPFRYSYISVLTAGFVLKCAGSLIAPDILLTAAHCSESFQNVQVGRHNRSDATETYESLIVEKIITHPMYYRNRFLDPDPYDFAIVKLYGHSRLTRPVKINRNSKLPTPNEQLFVFGWGAIDNDDWNDQSDVLRETVAYYIPNEDCKSYVGTYRGSEVDFDQVVIDVTLCAMDFDNLTDSCRGDSGGGLIIKGQSAEDDILVGVVSAGYGCANPTLPALYARISEVHGWIRDNVCDLSAYPPTDFECESYLEMEGPENDDFNAAATITGVSCDDLPIGRDNTNSTITSSYDGIPCSIIEPLVNITLVLHLDTRPEERGWIIRTQDARGKWITEVERPVLSYRDPKLKMSTVSETLSIRNNREYELVLLDSFGDGNSPLSLTTTTEIVRIVDLEGNVLLSVTDFSASNNDDSYHASFTFTVGVPATIAPSTSSAPTATMTPSSSPTYIRPFISVVITFDLFPENIGFRLEKFENSTVAAAVKGKRSEVDQDYEVNDDDHNSEYELLDIVYPGTFAPDLANTQITVTAPLQLASKSPQTYFFTMTSNEGHGFLTGGYEVWLGNEISGEFLFKGGPFYYEDIHNFYVDSRLFPPPIPTPPTVTPPNPPLLSLTDDAISPAISTGATSAAQSSFALVLSLILMVEFLGKSVDCSC